MKLYNWKHINGSDKPLPRYGIVISELDGDEGFAPIELFAHVEESIMWLARQYSHRAYVTVYDASIEDDDPTYYANY